MLFGTWKDLLRILAVGVPVYFVLLMMLRVTGKRALAKMNAFDLVITIALGSTLATAFVSKETTLADGVFAFALLLGLQYLVSLGALRWPLFRKLITEQPRVLVYQGKLLHRAMTKDRITEEVIHAAVRSAGHLSMDEVNAVILENDGSFSVIPASGNGTPSAMDNVRNFPPGDD